MAEEHCYINRCYLVNSCLNGGRVCQEIFHTHSVHFPVYTKKLYRCR